MVDQIYEVKKEKFLELRNSGAFSDFFEKNMSCSEALNSIDGTKNVKIAGRITSLRVMGKILFAHIYDITEKIQICVKKTEENPEIFERFKEDISVGDFVGVEGELFITKTGEKTLRVEICNLLNKSLRTLPEKWHGLEDIEKKYRQRYLDIIVNEKSRDSFVKRIKLVKCIRKYLENDGYLEVETPILQAKPSGAVARPFFTQHNALGIQCCLRIAPETYLKRCIGAGFDKVYEFARCFRNEGISHQHLQDFTMLEFYAAYWNAKMMIKFVEGMFRNVFSEIYGTLTTTVLGHEINFSEEWKTYDYSELILNDSGIDIRIVSSKEELLKELSIKKIFIEDAVKMSWGNIVDNLYKKVSRPKLISPCFIVKYPAETAPLARRNSQDLSFVDRFQFVVAGVEIVNAYSELVDPVDQRERLEEQAKARNEGDEEAMLLDEDFLLAMEHGFPPICGVGIGIDRLLMILCGLENIKDGILFPLMRPQE